MPLWRAPWAEHILPVMIDARLGIQIGFAT